MLLEQSEYVVGRVECYLTGKSVGQDSYPDCDWSGDDGCVRDNLSVFDGFVVVIAFDTFVAIGIFGTFVVVSVFDVLFLFNPAKTNKVDRRMPDVSLVQEFDNL